MKNKDFATMGKLLRAQAAPGYTFVEGGQSMTLDGMIQHLTSGIKSIGTVRFVSSKLVSLQEGGKTATAKMVFMVAGVMAGAPKVKPTTVTSTGDATDTFVKVGGKWKLKKEVWGKQKILLNGKPLGEGGG